jgi:hypothetical protein
MADLGLSATSERKACAIPGPQVPAVCRKCGRPVRIWGGLYYGEAEPDGRGGWRAPIARMGGGFYEHSECPR